MKTNHWRTKRRRHFFGTWAGLLFASLFSMTIASAQNINVTTPLTSVNDSYYENFGVNFGFSFGGGRGDGSRVVGFGRVGQPQGNLVFRQQLGGYPPFGGYNPGAGGSLGFGRVGPNGGFSVGMNFAKGSSRSIISSAPSLTVQNGFGGSIFSGGSRPFVTGIVPVVGQGGIDNGVTRALQSGQLDLTHRPTETPRVSTGPSNYSVENSSAMRGDASVRQIKAARQHSLAGKQQKLQATIDEAKALALEGKFVEARTKFREARSQTDDKRMRQQIKAWIKAAHAN